MSPAQQMPWEMDWSAQGTAPSPTSNASTDDSAPPWEMDWSPKQAAESEGGTAESSSPYARDMPLPQQSSVAGALARGAARGAIPAAAGMVGFGAGAEAGGALGLLGGPIAPFTVPAGSLIGGLIGAYVAATTAGKAQEAGLKALPDAARAWLGQSDEQRQADLEQHPYAAQIGELAPQLAMMRPGATATAVREGATSIEKLLANPLAARATGAALMGGQEAAQESGEGQEIDPVSVAIAAGAGAAMNRETGLGARLSGAGAGAVRAVGRPFAKPPAPRTAADGVADVMSAGSMDDAIRAADQASQAEPYDIEAEAAKADMLAQAGEQQAIIPPHDTLADILGEEPEAPHAEARPEEAATTEPGIAPESAAETPAEPVPAAHIKTDTATTAAGTEIPVNYAIVSADDLTASQLDDMRPNPAYPAEVQPRDRARVASEAQIADIANNLRPRELGESPMAANGAPIIDTAGVVESGNARTLAIKRAYDNNLPAAQEYRTYLEQQGYPVENIAKPVLVRIRTNELNPEQRAQFVREANDSGVLGMGAGERAMADASALPDSALDLYRGGDVTAAQNRPFVRAFMDHAVGKADSAGMIGADGSLSTDAARRIEGALLAKAYGDAQLVTKLTESPDLNIRAIAGSLSDVAPVWAKLKADAKAGSIPPEMDQTPALVEAARLVSRARDEGRNVAEYVAQNDMLSGRAVSPEAEGFLRLMFRDQANFTNPVGRAKITDALHFYADEARKASSGVDMLGEKSPGPAEILDLARERQFRNASTGQTGLNLSARNIGANPGVSGETGTRSGIPDAGVPRGTGTAGEGSKFALGAEPENGVAPKFALAYHGSPYDFDRFSNDAIGSGEGAQAYGYGHYFAGNREVAEFYRDALSRGRQLTDAEVAEYFKPGNIVQGYGGRDRVVSFQPPEYGPHGKPWSVEVYGVDKNGDRLPGFDGRLRVHHTVPNAREFEAVTGRKATGKLYQVNLAPKDEEYLDWDKSLSDQSEKVKTALIAAGVDIRPDITGGDLYDQLSRQWDSKEAASRDLHQSGIPGIRYLDQGSRASAARVASAKAAIPAVKQNIEVIKHNIDAVESGRLGETNRAHGTATDRANLKFHEDRLAQLEREARGEQTHNYVIFDPSQIEVQAKFDRRVPLTNVAARQDFAPKSTVTPEGTRLVYRPEFEARSADLANLLQTELTKMGLGKIAVRVADEIRRPGGEVRANAYYWQRMITMALDTKNPLGILNHEVVHALKDMGLFTPGEWRILEAEARRKWMNDPEIAERLKLYPDVTPENRLEEAVAMAAERGPAATPSPFAARIFSRVRDFFRALGNALRGNGFATPESIFRGIREGRFGERLNAREREAGPKFALSDEELPEGYKFVHGLGYAKEKWGAEGPDGRLAGGLHDTKAQAANAAKTWLQDVAYWQEKRAAEATMDRAIAARVSAGGDATDADLAHLKLHKAARFDYISPVVQRLFGISRAKVRQAMGDALHPSYSDMGVKIWFANSKKALRNAADFAAKTNKPHEPATEPGAVDAKGKPLPQLVIPGAERSAKQAAASRETGSGRIAPKAPQKEAGGLFAEHPPEQTDLFGKPKFALRTITGANKETAPYTPEQLRAYENVGRITEVPTLRERLDAARADLGRRFVRYWLDPYIGVKQSDPLGYMALRNANTTAGAVEQFLTDGTIKFSGSTYAMKRRNGGVEHYVIRPLHGEQDRFLWWVAAHRAEKLSAEDRENLWTPKDIAAIKGTNQGTTTFDYRMLDGSITRDRRRIYVDSLAKMDVFNRNVMDLAAESGLISRDKADALLSNPFYVPFYREAEGAHFTGARPSKEFVRQYAFKTLTGGAEKLHHDLWQNAFGNWTHMIDASLRNKAANRVLDTAVANGAVRPLTETETAYVPKSQRAGLMWTMRGGQKQYFHTTDNMLLTAISALDFSGYKNPIAKAATKFKTLLTMGVTADPRFMLRIAVKDAEQAIATAPMSYNMLGNVVTGFKMNDLPGALQNIARAVAGEESHRLNISNEAADAIAGGATMRLGYGNETGHRKTPLDATVLDTHGKLRAFWGRVSTVAKAYKEAAAQGEDVNRLALYHQLIAQGVPHDEAVFAGRDLEDFTLRGAGIAARILTQTVPFMNAWAQGLYKVGRSAANADKNITIGVGRRVVANATRRVATVLGATTLLTLALDSAYHDDEDYQKRSEYDRNTYFWFKFGNTQYRVPMGFEIAALSRIASNGIEAFFDKEMTPRRFMNNLESIVLANMAMNPTPQIIKPLVDVATNQSGSGAPIERMGFENVQSQERYNAGSTLFARALSAGGSSITRAVAGPQADFLSPIQIDYIINGYFGWLGSMVLGTADRMVRSVSNEPVRPAMDLWDFATGGIVQGKPSLQSRYVDLLYQQASAIDKAFGTYEDLIHRGRGQEAAEYFAANKDIITKHGLAQKAVQLEGEMNRQIRLIENSSNMSADEKRTRIEALAAVKNASARQLFAPH